MACQLATAPLSCMRSARSRRWGPDCPSRIKATFKVRQVCASCDQEVATAECALSMGASARHSPVLAVCPEWQADRRGFDRAVRAAVRRPDEVGE